jgi:hypothetical protein
MFAYELPLNPPIDNLEQIEGIMAEAFREFLKRGYNGDFRRIYDLVYEEIDQNLEKYLPQEECHVCNY